MDTEPKSNRARFVQWAQTGPSKRAEIFESAYNSLIPAFETAGFRCAMRGFDTGDIAKSTVRLERVRSPGQVDYVSLIFDKYHRPRFQVAFGVKEEAPPHKWVRVGSLVWRQDESVTYKWWGARWWHLNKDNALAAAIADVRQKVPQILRFLDGEGEGDNIWVLDDEKHAIASGNNTPV